MKRVVLIILDGVGIGYLPDAEAYGDTGSNTLVHIAEHVNGFNLPNLEKFGLGKIEAIQGLRADLETSANFGKMIEKSAGKDSTTGHWEIAGLYVEEPFPTYPDGFPDEVISAFEKATGTDVIGNIPASGTEIIKQLGEEHLITGKIIVYTSADSVFQIAVNTDEIPLEKLYSYCKQARELLVGQHAVARVIARPFSGTKADNFVRTKDRKDYSLAPFGNTLHKNLQDAGIETVGIGKINDLYNCYGISRSIYTKSNDQGMKAISDILDETTTDTFIMANLVDFDALWGHRNDPVGFYRGLQEFDEWLPTLTDKLHQDDILILTADHGNDPTFPGTDHTREYVPLLVYGPGLLKGQNLGTCETFSDIQATVAEYFKTESTGVGVSFLNKVMGG